MAYQNSSYKIFIVEDDKWYNNFLQYTVSLNPEYIVESFFNAKDVLANLHKKPDLITVDYSLPDIKGDELIKKIKDQLPDTQIIVISGQEDVQTAVQLLKLGVYDYILKDEDTKHRILNTIQNARSTTTLKEEIVSLREEVAKKYDFSNTIIGNSDAIKKCFTLIEKAASSKIVVSVTGETGTGKELVAKAIHYHSDRKKMTFVAVNIAAIPRDLIESELFGHEKGAFTGADARRIGKFEQANKGTLFLDEIGEMEITMQAKLLRVLQEKEVTRVGGNQSIPLDVRIIVATHRNLANEVKEGRFREDLYYRLLGLQIALPPLNERGNDIILLCKHFIDDYCKENKVKKITMSNEAQKKLFNYHFPGNIRELKAIIELACVMCNNGVIEATDLTFNSEKSLNNMLVQEMSLDDYNNLIIKNYLEKYDNNVLTVAKKLNIGKSTIYRMLKAENADKKNKN